jgi:hypothetical protein
MGWNTTALFLRGAAADEAVAALAPAEPTGEWVGLDEATLGQEWELLYAGQSGDWAQVWNPSGEHVLTYRPDGSSALTGVFSSVATTYGFTLYVDGEPQRDFVYSEGETPVNVGAPLPVEAGIEVPSWGPDEDYLWAVIEAVTGATYDESLRLQAYRLRPA